MILSAFIIVFSSFIFGYFICRVFGIDKKLSVLISSGSSICGAAALMATQSIVKASPNAVAIALCSVAVFGSLGMFVYCIVPVKVLAFSQVKLSILEIPKSPILIMSDFVRKILLGLRSR